MTQGRFGKVVRYTTAKIVLVGERSAGKSCLAMRLVKDQHPDALGHGAEHGIHLWRMALEQLSSSVVASEGQRREIVLWDMDGQDTYQLVNQLFLHDSALAIVVVDLTRGNAVFDEVKAWSEQLEKQSRRHSTMKLLVGSKMDNPNEIADENDMRGLCQDCGFHDYYETSALTGRGVPELREAISETLDWHGLPNTSHPELFQRIQDEIIRRRNQGEIILPVADLEKVICNADLEVPDGQAIGSVVEQLAAQGEVVDTRMASGEQALALKIEEVERYARALIIDARDNSLVASALRKRNLDSPNVSLPGIKAEDRLPRLHEKGIIECVTQLLVEHDICLPHGGLLIFPSLFRRVRKSDMEDLSDFVSFYYDSARTIDESFGANHMLLDRTDFGHADKGLYGIRKTDLGRGFAHTAKMPERGPKLRIRISAMRNGSADGELIRILHLSDLHFRQDTDIHTVLRPLVTDIRYGDGLGFKSLDYLVISGDMSNCAAPEEFKIARQFISELIEKFGLTEDCCILVPGNHDQSWDEEVYDWQQDRRVDVDNLEDGHHRKEGCGYLIRDDRRYPGRFRNFSEFLYYPLMQSQYTLSFEDQCISDFFKDTGIQFLALNSCWEIDEYFQNRASIHEGALARGLNKADDQSMYLMDKDVSVLRIAVWHHPIEISSGIENCAFTEHLKAAKFRLVLHGHVHEERTDVLYRLHRSSIHVVGTGSFGAPAAARPKFAPCLYSLLEIARDHSSVRVHTRCQNKQDGSWKPWHFWPTNDSDTGRSYYEFRLD